MEHIYKASLDNVQAHMVEYSEEINKQLYTSLIVHSSYIYSLDKGGNVVTHSVFPKYRVFFLGFIYCIISCKFLICTGAQKMRQINCLFRIKLTPQGITLSSQYSGHVEVSEDAPFCGSR